MNVLMVGVGQGSWQVRGVQLGRAIGARVTSQPSEQDIRWADVIVLVKRALLKYIDEIRAVSDACVIWDAVDFWIQPEENGRPIADVVAEVRDAQQRHGIALVIGATQSMADAVGGAYLPHHSRPGLMNAPTRHEFRTLAYEGTKKYLGSWGRALLQACASLDLNLVINPPDLRDADLIVAFRGEQWDGPICREWKSGVKVVNAIAAGRPVISQASAAMLEIQPFGTVVADRSELEQAIGLWRSYQARELARSEHEARAAEFSLRTIASQYRQILDQAWRRAA